MSTAQPVGRPQGRRELLDLVAQALGREFSTRTMLLHDAVADRLGLNGSDHKCLDLIQRAGRLTASDLVRDSGLTSGAITGVIDRLERGGYVRRVPDTNDRRRTFIEPVQGKADEISAMLQSLSQEALAVAERYSDAELVVIADFLEQAAAMMQRETRRLREDGPQQS